MIEQLTPGGRPAFVVNVGVHLHRDGRWLLIKRSENEAHAARLLSGVGGKVDLPAGPAIPDVLEQTAPREVAAIVHLTFDEADADPDLPPVAPPQPPARHGSHLLIGKLR
ncbi:hypothetical protein ACFQO7_10250 [Catellatospora aurea]|uniref:NUDIX domain-containing protein n=1 Tax=Catellatospora aurea TaxID=1337874 RepID=A0ABW2GV57_9ACTN